MSTDWERLARQNVRSPSTLAIQRLAGLTELMEALAESLNARAAATITCPTCRVTIPIRDSRPRQSCPFCGSFYNPSLKTESNGVVRRQNVSTIELPHIDGESRPRFSSFGSDMFNRFGNFLSESFSRRLSNIDYENNNLNSSFSSNDYDINTTAGLIRSRRWSRQANEDLQAFPQQSPFGTLRLGSGASLPPIKNLHQESHPRKDSSTSLRPRSHRSEERIPSAVKRELATMLPVYPQRNIKRHELLNEVNQAKQSKAYDTIKKFYFETFESYANICATFKRDPEYDGARVDDPGLKNELVHAVHDSLKEMPSVVHKHFMKGVINCLLQEQPHLFSKDQVRALFIILQSPVFLSQSSYNILAHVLRSITELSNGDHQLLVHWFKTMEVSRFKLVVGFIIQFITVRQFPPPDRSLPPLSSSKWWIPTGTKVLAILYASNCASNPALIHYTDFYNHALDHVDLMSEYRRWQTPDRPDTFSFCQYPFLLSIVAKRFILTKDAEQQMILTARRSYKDCRDQRQLPQLDIFFLNLQVRRNNLVQDSLREIADKKKDLKKKLRVTFSGEPGLDMGGLTKEWFLLLTKQIFKPENQMFVYHPSKRLYWFSMGGEGNLKQYNLIGVLMGLAVYNAIILDVRFPSICFRKLLSPPVVPPYDHVPVGVAKEPTLDDLAEIMPEVAHGLKELLKYEGDVEEDMCLSFQVSLDEYGIPRTINLKENGQDIPVTNQNREEFVKLYIAWILNTAIYDQFRAFYLGFHTVTASNALIMLRPEEVEMLVCGCPNLELNELRKVTEYDGYEQEHPVIKWFWQILKEMPLEQQKQFLLFTTGSDRIPVGGMGEMPFKISCWRDHTHMLPQAHTCFNQLVLPPYGDKEVLRSKLIIAINNAEGFGLE